MKISEFLSEIHKRDTLLFRSGLFLLIVSILLILPLAFDERLVMGVNPWIKPIKFCLSITIFVWTIAWMLHYFPRESKWRKFVSISIFWAMSIEIAIILVQAARGTTSHFNNNTPLDGILFGAMGFLIIVSTIATVVLFFMFILKKPKLEKVYYYSILLGIATFLLSSYMGSIMISNLAHSVGVEDGGPGIPFFNWSTEGGDLRAAHFFGLHAFQIFPLFAFFLHQKTKIQLNGRLAALMVLTIAYLGFLFFVFFQALDGKPLIG